MTENKNYLVSDIATELGVPRTTLNDWLKRFDRYLPSEMSGRRRAYTPAALEVLETVNKLRNDGLSVSRIDSELEKIFAIRPEEVLAESAVKSEKNDGNTESAAAAESNEDNLSLPVLPREQFDRFFGTMEEFSRLEKKRRRNIFYVWVMIMLLAVLSVITAWYLAHLVKIQAANSAHLKAISKANADARIENQVERKEDKKALAAQKKEIQELKKSVISARSEQQKQLKKTEELSQNSINKVQDLILSMQNEQKEFRKNLEKRFEKELNKRDSALTKAEKAYAAESAKVREQQKELETLRKEKEQLSRELEAMKKAASDRETKAAEAAETASKQTETTQN